MQSLTNRLVQEYTDVIFRASYTYLGSKSDVEDVCQEVLIKLIQKEEPFESLAHERNWVVRVTINACKDLLRKRASHLTMVLDEAPEPSTSYTCVEDESELEPPGKILPYVMKLPIPYREVIFLYYYEEQSAKQIAEALGCSEAAVSIRLSRARKQLKAMLGEVDDARAV